MNRERKLREQNKNFTFSISDPGQTFIDKCISICPSQNRHGYYDVWLHAADFSFYLKENSPLDLESKQRCRTLKLDVKIEYYLNLIQEQYQKEKENSEKQLYLDKKLLIQSALRNYDDIQPEQIEEKLDEVIEQLNYNKDEQKLQNFETDLEKYEQQHQKRLYQFYESYKKQKVFFEKLQSQSQFKLFPEEFYALSSLQEGEENLAYTCYFQISEKGEVDETEMSFKETIITNSCALNYNQFGQSKDKLLTKGDLKLDQQILSQVKEQVNMLYALYMKIQKSKKEDGKYNLKNYKKKPDSTLAKKIIKEFTQIANHLAGIQLNDLGTPFAVYETSNFMKKVDSDMFKQMCEKFGVCGPIETQKDFNLSVQQIFKQNNLDKCVEPLIENYFIRKQFSNVKYVAYKEHNDSDENQFWNEKQSEWLYSCFTKPSKRYIDLIVHRILKQNYKSHELSELKSYLEFYNDTSQKVLEVQRLCKEQILYYQLISQEKMDNSYACILSIDDKFIHLVSGEHDIDFKISLSQIKQFKHDTYNSQEELDEERKKDEKDHDLSDNPQLEDQEEVIEVEQKQVQVKDETQCQKNEKKKKIIVFTQYDLINNVVQQYDFKEYGYYQIAFKTLQQKEMQFPCEVPVSLSYPSGNKNEIIA